MNGKQLAVLIAVIGAAAVLLNVQQSSTVSEFESWKGKHGVKYASEFENAYRERIFLENLAKINTHNSNKLNTYEMGLNQFSAMTNEEFVQQYLGTIVAESSNDIESVDDVQSVGDIDWTTQGAVTPIKNQGNCGSCWAFSATAAVENAFNIKLGKSGSRKDDLDFSEQQLVDCSRGEGNGGCNGGWMNYAFNYLNAHGFCDEKKYPYKAVD